MVVTVADVLKHAESFEKILGAYYERLAEETRREGVRLLAGYMSRHRVRIGEALDKLPHDRVERIRSTPIHYEPQGADCRCFDGMDLPPDATAAQVLDAAVVFDECLIRLYRQAVRQTEDEEVRDLFESLIHAEESDEIELKKIKAMDYF